MMTDIVDADTRSRMMAAIRGKDTRPEWVIRSALHRAGFRFRLHDRRLPGTPDIVLPKHRTVIFVHGCFWHRHGGCRYTTTPATRPDFWQKKFEGNVERDARHRSALKRQGWRVVVIWECGIRHEPEAVVGRLSEILRSGDGGSWEVPAVPPRMEE